MGSIAVLRFICIDFFYRSADFWASRKWRKVYIISLKKNQRNMNKKLWIIDFILEEEQDCRAQECRVENLYDEKCLKVKFARETCICVCVCWICWLGNIKRKVKVTPYTRTPLLRSSTRWVWLVPSVNFQTHTSGDIFVVREGSPTRLCSMNWSHTKNSSGH